jgi:hypothetical protein
MNNSYEKSNYKRKKISDRIMFSQRDELAVQYFDFLSELYYSVDFILIIIGHIIDKRFD